MSKYWIESKKPEFVRDILRDFCLSYQLLFQEFYRYDQTGIIDFYFLLELLGVEMNQGQLWRLKDTAHLLFRSKDDVPELEQLLDWSLGYIFHECTKLKEDAYQQNFYIPWLEKISQSATNNPEQFAAPSELLQATSQTKESIQREVDRIRFIINHCLKLLIQYLPLHSENPYLARFLFDQNELVQDVFAQSYNQLIKAMYGNNQEKMYVLAARSLRQGGWIKKAVQAVETALKINPGNTLALQEREIIASIQTGSFASQKS